MVKGTIAIKNQPDLFPIKYIFRLGHIIIFSVFTQTTKPHIQI